MDNEYITIGGAPITIEQVMGIASGEQKIHLRDDREFRDWIARGPQILEEKWLRNEPIYGVTTGVGESCVRRIPVELVPDFSPNLARFHGCGLGRTFDVQTTAAIIVVRLVSLARGYSAVRYEVLDRLSMLVRRHIWPLIPEEGSVGASGDLTPLSYLAAFLMGEREAIFEGRTRHSREIHDVLGLEPLRLQPKESLALMNGTAVMTAVACHAFIRAERLASMAARLTAILCEALRGNKAHFDLRLFEHKPHPGQMLTARRIATDLMANGPAREVSRIQDTYALRCAPHIIGVLEDALPWLRTQIENEINSSNDNPLIDPETSDVLHGGNFYGGHIAFAMDCLKVAVANVADLMDRQMALLMNPHRNQGLPLNLSGAVEDRKPVNHGFKAIQIACSAWTAEALRNTTAASIFSRSTESHNQDKVSMGTIAARDAIRVLELTEQVLAGTLFAAVQAIDCRIQDGTCVLEEFSEGVQETYRQTREITDFVEEDRPLEPDLRRFLEGFRTGCVDCHWPDFASDESPCLV